MRLTMRGRVLDERERLGLPCRFVLYRNSRDARGCNDSRCDGVRPPWLKEGRLTGK